MSKDIHDTASRICNIVHQVAVIPWGLQRAVLDVPMVVNNIWVPSSLLELYLLRLSSLHDGAENMTDSQHWVWQVLSGEKLTTQCRSEVLS